MSLAHVDKTRFTKHEGNGSAARTLQEALHLPRKEFWWKRYFKWENNLTVAGRTVEKGWVITPAIGAVIVGALLTAGWATYTSGQSEQRETRDAIIRMETMLDERTKMFDRQQDKLEQELKDERAVAELKRDLHEKRVWRMEQAITQRGIKIVD